MEPDSAKQQQGLTNARPRELYEYAVSTCFAGGEFQFGGMNFFERTIIKHVARTGKNVSRIKEDGIARFAIKYKKMKKESNKVVLLKEVPSKSIILAGFGNYDYADSCMVNQSTNLSVDKIAAEIFKMSGVDAVLMKVRDSIARPFGLKVSGNEAKEQDYYPAGSKLMIFTVSARNENEIVMEDDDRHLKFRTSVFIDREESKIYLTTVVKYHNWMGWLYFIPVKPVHQMLVKSRLKKKMAKMNRVKL